nr:hypothetical protein Q903MT_gene6044 [Picea sitchensis]
MDGLARVILILGHAFLLLKNTHATYLLGGTTDMPSYTYMLFPTPRFLEMP